MPLRILQLCTRIPFPPQDGGTIAMYNLAKSLADCGCTVKILAFNTKKHFIAGDKIDDNFRKEFNLTSVYLDASIKASDAFLNLFSSESYNIRRFISEEFKQQLIIILRDYEFDIIQMESLFMAPYLETVRHHSKAKIVLRAHNVEHVIWERLHLEEKNIFKKWYLKLLTQRLHLYEKEMLNKFDALLPLTPDDEKVFNQLGAKVAVNITPIGVDVQSYKSEIINEQQPFSIFHLGSMDWLPNIEAVDWFLKNVWNDLHRSLPQVQLHLAGKAMPDRIFSQQNDHLKVYGTIDNARKFMTDKQIMIVPLLSGSGMRVKILEGLAAGKVIVSTSIGAEGIKYIDGENLFIADTPDQFIKVTGKLFSDEQLIKNVSRKAVELAYSEYDNKIIAQRLIAFYKTLTA
ncbi:MAG: glycosyltransferase [Bacteroidia bacterium]